MKKINPIVAAAMVIFLLVVVVFVIRKSSTAADANGADLTPKPRENSPTFAAKPEDIAAGKSKTRKAPEATSDSK